MRAASYANFGWPLYKKYGHAYEAFKRCVASDEAAEELVKEFSLDAEVNDSLVKNIRRWHCTHETGWHCLVVFTCILQ